MVTILVTTLGFDADLILRELSKSLDIKHIICFSLWVDEASFKRVQSAFNTIKFFVEKLGGKAELRYFVMGKGLIRSILNELEKIASEAKDVIVMNLTGGPRLLVVATIIALLMLDSRFAEKIILSVEGETFEGSLEISLKLMKSLLRLDDDSEKIFRTILIRGRMTASEVSRETGIPKSTTYKKLRELAQMGLLILVGKEKGEEYSINPELSMVLF